MKSPITGKEMVEKTEQRKMEFRREEYEIVFHYFLCEDSGEQFTNTEQDVLNMEQVYNQHRDRHNLPFPDEVKEIREKYDLSASKMSEILGFGANSYRNYESGEIPNDSNGKLIRLAADPQQFKNLADMCDCLEDKPKQRLLHKINSLITEGKENRFRINVEDFLMDGNYEGELNGYVKPNLRKLGEMVVFFTQAMQPWKTQMNKLLFYGDFVNYKLTGHSISGTQYRAIGMGPVPRNYQSVFEYLANTDVIDIYSEESDDGKWKEQFKPNSNREFNPEVFNESELKSLELVLNNLKTLTTKQIIELSHAELAWKKYEKEHKLIPYSEAFSLKGIKY